MGGAYSKIIKRWLMHDISITVCRIRLIFGTWMPYRLVRKPIDFDDDTLYINEWAWLIAKISRDGSGARYLNNRRSD